MAATQVADASQIMMMQGFIRLIVSMRGIKLKRDNLWLEVVDRRPEDNNAW